MDQTNSSSSDSFKDTLSIQVSLNGLSFCIVNRDHGLSTLEHIDFDSLLSPELALDKLVQLFNEHTALNTAFQNVNVVYQNELYTLVPLALFDENLMDTYLKSNIKVLPNDFIAYDILTHHELAVVYIPYVNINNFLFDTFGAFTYAHSITQLIDTLLSKEKNNTATAVYANKHHHSFDLVIIQQGKLLLANTFDAYTKEDFLYHLLFATEQLGLNPEEFPLYCLGDITESDAYFTLAYQYIRHVSILDAPQEYLKNKISFSEIDVNTHFTLLSTL